MVKESIKEKIRNFKENIKEVIKTRKKQIFLLTFISFIIVVGVILIINSTRNNITGFVSDKLNISLDSSGNQICRETQIPYEDKEEYTEQIAYDEEVCSTKELNYSIDDFIIDYLFCAEEDETCINYTQFGECISKEVYCVDKRVACSLTLSNKDSKAGSWTLNFKFLDAQSKEIVESVGKGSFIEAGSSAKFNASARFLGKEEASKVYSCGYELTNIPTKADCVNVTRYKDVTKTRMVTKYKTEQVCE